MKFDDLCLAIGGMALLLYGMLEASEGLQRAAGARMRTLLSLLTRNRFLALGAGVAVTFSLQSSTATSVLLVSLVNAGLMAFRQTAGVILGADIGTTLTIQIIAFDLTDYALLALAGGFVFLAAGRALPRFCALVPALAAAPCFYYGFDGAGAFLFVAALLFFWAKTAYVENHAGRALLGFGLVFYGIDMMKHGFMPLRDLSSFQTLIAWLSLHPVLLCLAAAAFTAVIHSSAATLGLLIALASGDAPLFTIATAVPVIFGANLGTCATALLASLKANRAGKRVAFLHTLFKALGTLVFFPFLGLFAVLALYLDKLLTPGLEHQIANVHTLFNVGLAIVFLPLLSPLTRLVEAMLPEHAAAAVQLTFANRKQMAYPRVLLENLDRDIALIAGKVEALIGRIPELFAAENEAIFDRVREADNEVDILYSRLVELLTEFSGRGEGTPLSRELISRLQLLKELETTADIVSKDLRKLAQRKLRNNFEFAVGGDSDLSAFHGRVLREFRQTQTLIPAPEGAQCRQLLDEAERVNEEVRSALRRHVDRCAKGVEDAVVSGDVFTDALQGLKLIHYTVVEIAKILLRLAEDRTGK